MPDHSFFNPNLTSTAENKIFGLPFDFENSQLILMQVPWEVTTSYGRGTSRGPEAILKASPQLDLFNPQHKSHYEKGYFLNPRLKEIETLNRTLCPLAESIIDELEASPTPSPIAREGIAKINAASDRVNQLVYEEAMSLLSQGKKVGLIGGDHSSPFGFIKALSEHHSGKFGILHIDAHHDLRVAYQGFTHSHASIMYNVMTLAAAPKKLIQIGIRDFCEDEFNFAENDKRIHCYYDHDINDQLSNGNSWSKICQELIYLLPEKVYISFDIDGLSPDFCPNTGTPVPGGMSFSNAIFLLKSLVKSNKQIVGFDLCEVAPDPQGQSEWDGNVGARILFNLCNWMMESHG